MPFVLTYAPSHQPLPAPIDAAGRACARPSSSGGMGRPLSDRRASGDEAVVALADHAEGAHLRADRRHRRRADHLAAGTASAAMRNWDYRFCWLRDATLTLLALMNAGYYEEARAWRDWLLRAVAGSRAAVQIMYGLAGERRLTEWEVPWLPGYEGSRPVRIGNAAHSQLQLDVYGEVMDALHQARQGGLGRRRDAAGHAARLLDASGNDLARARRGHLGSARRARGTSPTQGDGLGRLRPRDQERRAASAWTGPSTAGATLRDAHPRRGLRARLRRRARQLRAVLRLEGARRQPAADAAGRLSAARRSAHRAARSRRSSATCVPTASCCATTRDQIRRRPAARRGRVPRLHLLARRQPSS